MPGYVEEELRGYLECGILCFGFGRALCTGCGQGFVIAFSCKGRGVCPSCNGRHMAQTAAHLVDHVIPPVPVRQWVISVPKRLRCFLANRPEAVAALTKIFLAEIERLLSTAVGVMIDAAAPAAARPRLGAISFLHRFGSALRTAGFPSTFFVRIAFIDRDVPSYFQSLEHLLRSFARPPFALERLSVIRGPAGRITQVGYVLPRRWVTIWAANWVGRDRGRKSKRPGAHGVVEFTPFEFLDRLADLVPPPRKHRHRYHGVFAPNHKLRPAVTAQDKREHRQAARGCDRWACGRRSRHGGLL